MIFVTVVTVMSAWLGSNGTTREQYTLNAEEGKFESFNWFCLYRKVELQLCNERVDYYVTVRWSNWNMTPLSQRFSLNSSENLLNITLAVIHGWAICALISARTMTREVVCSFENYKTAQCQAGLSCNMIHPTPARIFHFIFNHEYIYTNISKKPSIYYVIQI